MTPSLLRNCLNSAFLRKLKTTYKKKSLEFKALLILHCPLGAADAFANVHPDVKVVFRTSCLFQVLERLDRCLIQPFRKT